MNSTIQYIQEELKDLYPNTEVWAISKIIMEYLFKEDYHKILAGLVIPTGNQIDRKVYEIVKRLKNHEPIQYILGETIFFDLKISVNPGVLIPRPETEELVQWIVESISLSSPAILDIGTGSGCIALALKWFLKNANVSGLDYSEGAIRTARQNAKINKLDVSFFYTDIKDWRLKDWHNYDIIVSNPPYILEKEKLEMLDNVLKFEPEDALFVKNNEPLIFYRIIAGFAYKYLSSSGWLYFEINESFGRELMSLMLDEGFKNVELKKDINGKDRMLRGQK